VPSEPASEVPSEPASEPPSVEPESPPASEPASEVPSEPASEVPSEVPSEPASEVPSEPASEVPSEPASEQPSEQASPTTEPESQPPSEAPSVEPATANVLIAKVNNKGTATIDDDRLVGGATFKVWQDNGDGKFEPDGADAPVVATIDAPEGWATVENPPAGSYWIQEVSPPSGLQITKPFLVHYKADPTKVCFTKNGDTTCRAAAAGESGFHVVIVSDTPVGMVPPPTDTEDVTASTDTRPDPWLLLTAGLLAILAGAAAWRRSRHAS
jgi:hypothetical protein